MFSTISKTSTTYRLASMAWAALTTTEARAFYSEIAATTISIAKAIAHGLLYLLAIVDWGLSLAWCWVRGEWPRLVQAIQPAIRAAVDPDAGAATLAQWSARAIATLKGWAMMMQRAAE
jgi:hypothetical protein